MLQTNTYALGTMPKVSIRELVEVIRAQTIDAKRRVVERLFGKRSDHRSLPVYQTAKRLIREFHKGRHAASWLRCQAADLRRSARDEAGWRHNDLVRSASALERYGLHFGDRELSLDTAPRLELVRRGVRVTCPPDIFAHEGIDLKLLRLHLQEDPPTAELLRIAPVVMLAAATQYGFDVAPSNSELVVVRPGLVVVAEDVTRVMQLVDRTCTLIQDFWGH